MSHNVSKYNKMRDRSHEVIQGFKVERVSRLSADGEASRYVNGIQDAWASHQIRIPHTRYITEVLPYPPSEEMTEMSFINYVFVQNGDGQPLSPCHPAVARRLLREKQAIVFRAVPFTLRLSQTKEAPQPDSCSAGIDDGAKTAGVAVVQHNQNSERVVFKGELPLRGNTKKLHSNRKMRRRSRRSRCRRRQSRSRRKDKTGRVPVSIEVRKDNVVRVLRDLCNYLPIRRIVYEEGQFDVTQLQETEGETGSSKPSSPGRGLPDANRRQAVLWRDRYICQYCKRNCIREGLVAEVDHLIPKSRGGTSSWANLVCSCQKCNQEKGSQIIW